MKKSEAIKRVTKFLENLSHISLDCISENFKHTDRRYFIYLDNETRGVFDNEYRFATKNEINDIISLQMNNEDGKWDHVVIFDVVKNKIIEPKI